MPPAELAQVERLILSLSPDELARVRGKLAFLATTGTPADKPTTGRSQPNGDWLLESLLYELQRRGLITAGRRPPVARISSSYADAAAGVREELEEHLPNLKPVERVSLGRLVAGSLVEYLIKIGVPVTLRTVFNNVDKSLVALDDAFPGYLAAGLLRFCWDQPS